MTDKYYIGQTLSHEYVNKKMTWIARGLKERWTTHKRYAKNGSKLPLHVDIREYGEDQFVAEEVNRYDGKDIFKLNEFETKYILEYKSISPSGYNKILDKPRTGLSRRMLLNHYNSKHKEKISFDQKIISNSKREDRSSQIFLEQHIDLYDFLLEYSVYKIRIYKYNQAYKLQAFVFENIDTFVKCYKHIKDAIKDSEYFKDCAEIEINRDNTYKYQYKLDRLKDTEILRIYGGKSYHFNRAIYVYNIFLRTAKEGVKKYSFGGKTIAIEESYNIASDFAKRLSEMKNIEFSLKPI